MSDRRYLIVNADDFGQSVGINRGIIKSFEKGIVTSASLMVRWPAAHAACRYAREHNDLSVGLHVDLGEWTYRGGNWIPIYEVVQLEDSAKVNAEVSRQLETFRTLTGKDPSHLDSHQHVHRSEPIRSILAETANQLGIPLRSNSDVHYCGAFYGQTEDGEPLLDNISKNALARMISDLPYGVTELGCHPAEEVDFETMYRGERVHELETLCDREIRELIAKMKVELCSFHRVSEIWR